MAISALNISSKQIVLGERIAEGGFAVVYAAIWFDLHVAIKMMSLTKKAQTSTITESRDQPQSFFYTSCLWFLLLRKLH
ncbi:hypothetical protein GEMRC1_012207 [Eukaryota sp. GEM-RC1]